MDLSFLNAVGGVKVVVGVVVAIVTLMIIARLMKAGRVDTHTQKKLCSSCGWEGNVSTFKPKCPKCAKAMT